VRVANGFFAARAMSPGSRTIASMMMLETSRHLLLCGVAHVFTDGFFFSFSLFSLLLELYAGHSSCPLI